MTPHRRHALRLLFLKDGDEYYVDRGLYVNFLNQFSTWIEEEAAQGKST